MVLALRVFLPFALAYLLSYLLRTVNAVAGAPLAMEFDLSSGDLGLMTSVYFIGFASAQLPFGILMDRYGARRVEALSWVVATAGCLMFAIAATGNHLLFGRFLMGLGASLALMGPMTAYRRWFRPDRRALVISVHMAFGGLGSALSGGPSEALLAVIGWRGLFLVLAGASLAAGAMIALVVPRRNEPTSAIPMNVLGREMLAVFASRSLWRLAPLSATIQTGMLAIVSLWSGPWLRQVVALPPAEAAFWVSAIAFGLIAGFLAYGVIFTRAERAGYAMPAFVVGALVTALFPLLFLVLPPAATPVLWVFYAAVCTVGVHSYNIVTSAFAPDMAGRVNTALNFVVFAVAFFGQWGFGLVLDAFPGTDGGATLQGFKIAFILVIAIQLASALPLLMPEGARPPNRVPAR